MQAVRDPFGLITRDEQGSTPWPATSGSVDGETLEGAKMTPDGAEEAYGAAYGVELTTRWCYSTGLGGAAVSCCGATKQKR